MAALLLTAGCARATKSEKAAIRRQRMENYWSQFKAEEKRRPEQMQEVAEMSHRMRLRHSERLRRDYKMIQDRYARELKDWRDQAPQRHEQAKKLLKGKPDQIDDTFHTMTD